MSAIDFEPVPVDRLGLDYTVDVDPLTGAAAARVGLPTTPGRSGFGPSLALSYGSGAGNSAFGVGWRLEGLASITIDLSKGTPGYDDNDCFAHAGRRLVPQLIAQGEAWVPRREAAAGFRIDCFRAVHEGGFARYERWTATADGAVHWRVREGDGTVSVYGRAGDGSTRIADPADPARVYAWLLEARFDLSGNAMHVAYAVEDGHGVSATDSFEAGRLAAGGGVAQRYPKRIRYGNLLPFGPDADEPAENVWLFETVFDYGDHDEAAPAPAPDRPWALRADPYSTYRAGFEVRTYRLCRRVLQYHRFEELGAGPTRVRSLVFEHRPDPAGTVLVSVTLTGHRREGAATAQRSLPPLVFDYAEPEIARAFHVAEPATLANLPAGLSGPRYQWLDIYGEGVPGVLTETDEAWYFKPSIGGGRFGETQRIAERPMHRVGGHTFADFDRDGNPNLVMMHGRHAGYCAFDRETGRWDGFRPFASVPNIFQGARLSWLDVSGDGRPDLIVADENRVTVFESLGREGFAPGTEVVLPRARGGGAPTVRQDRELDLFFADMSGDGAQDLVRVRNGHVEYWPQLGHGRFGPRVVMEDAPIFDDDGTFDAGRLRFVDLDGSGTMDLVYLGRGEVRTWINASGNRLVAGDRLSGLPVIDNLDQASILDFLGDGSSCLVWSTPLPGSAAGPLQYLPLTTGARPRLLLSVANSMGAVTTLSYGSSAAHYLRDKASERPWLTRLPQHVLVVEEKRTADLIGGGESVMRFRYRDGGFDSEERRFTGFGQVDIIDVPRPDAGGDASAPGLLTRIFHHSGALGSGAAGEAAFYRGDGAQGRVEAPYVEDVGSIDVDEFRAAYRALAGRRIRVETYPLDAQDVPEPVPFEVVQTGFRIRRLQPARAGRDAVFFVHQSESLIHVYERAAADPRVEHVLTLEVDAFGRSRLDCSIAYPRRGPAEAAAQSRAILGAARDRFEHRDTAAEYLTGIEIENERFELHGFVLPADGTPIRRDALLAQLQAALAAPLAHAAAFAADGGPQARRLEWARTFYWDAALGAALALGDFAARPLVHHEEEACFAEGFVEDRLHGRIDAAAIAGYGYTLRDGHWWRPGAISDYLAADGFFRLARERRPDGAQRSFAYDTPYVLEVTRATDPVGNVLDAVLDYHRLSPIRIEDANGLVREIRLDPLGVATVVTHYGRVRDGDGAERPYGMAPLAEHAPQPSDDPAAVLADPQAFVQNAASFTAYDLSRWQREGAPPTAVTLTRETLHHDGTAAPAAAGRVREEIAYLDGFGRVLQAKRKVAPGPAIQRAAAGTVVLDADGAPVPAEAAQRWRCSGFVLFDAKQAVVRAHEPFYTPVADFEDDATLRSLGLAVTRSYDARGRVIRVDMPDGTFATVAHEAWRTVRSEPGDTVEDSAWKAQREALPTSDPERRALEVSRVNAATPMIAQLDPSGRECLHAEEDGAGTAIRTEFELDAEGEMRAVVDPRGLRAVEREPDMLGRTAVERGIDAGERLSFFDVFDRQVESWDARGVRQTRSYDAGDRLLTVHAEGGLPGLDHTVQQLVYGESVSAAEAAGRNLRGRVGTIRDGAGELSFEAYDPMGNLLAATRRIRSDLEGEADWDAPGGVALEAEVFASRTAYDALGRSLRQDTPDGLVRELVYGADGLLDRLTVTSADGTLAPRVILAGAARNARGQRERLSLGNGAVVTASRDPRTARLRRLVTDAPRPGGGGPRRIQDIAYVYDASGNLTHVADQAHAVGGNAVIAGLGVGPECDFEYDALHRLTRATGRVHQALLGDDHLGGPGTVKHSRHLNLNDGGAIERYTRTYGYDPASNLLRMRHAGDSRSFTHDIWVSAVSNRSLSALGPAGTPVAEPENAFDASGNTVRLDHLRRIDWDHAGRMARAVLIERADGSADDAEHYSYNAQGLRLRKARVRLTGAGPQVEEVLYLDGCEIHRIRRNGTEILRRTSSVLWDGTVKLAILHRWQRDDTARETDDPAAVDLRYLLTNHLGSAAMEIDESGAIVSYEEYFPFGGTAFIAGDSIRAIGLKSHRHAGKTRDDATGLYAYEYRYYAPWIGNWISPDPAGTLDGLNLYAFVRNNPLTLVDLDGRQSSGASDALQLLDQVPTDYNERQVLAHFNNSRGLELGIYATDLRKEGNDWVIVEYERLNPRVLERLRGSDMPADVVRTLSVIEDVLGENPPGGDGGGDGAEEDAPPPPPGTPPPDPDAPPGAEDASGTDPNGDPDAPPAPPPDEPPDDAPSAPKPGDGKDDQAGPGLGTQGQGPGGGGTGTEQQGQGDTPGEDRGPGRTPGATGEGGGAEGSPGGSPNGSPNGSDTGSPTGSESGSDRGVPGGVEGGSGTGAPGGLEGGVEGGNSTDPSASRTPPPGGTPPPATGATPNGTDPNGRADGDHGRQGTGDRAQPGTEGGTRTSGEPGGRPGGAEQGEPGGDGGGGSAQETSTLDDLVRYAGYWHLEFGGSGKGESGGIPGGMGSLNLGAFGQIAFLALTVADIALTIASFGSLAALKVGVKLAIKGVMKLARRALTKAAQVMTRQFWRRAAQAVTSRFSRAGLARVTQRAKFGEWFRFWKDAGGVTNMTRLPGFWPRYSATVQNFEKAGTWAFRDTAAHEGFHAFLANRLGFVTWLGDLRIAKIPVGAPVKYVEEVFAYGIGRASALRLHGVPLAPLEAFQSLTTGERVFTLGVGAAGGYWFGFRETEEE